MWKIYINIISSGTKQGCALSNSIQCSMAALASATRQEKEIKGTRSQSTVVQQTNTLKSISKHAMYVQCTYKNRE